MEKNTLHPLIGLFCVCMSVSDLTRYKISDRESGKASKAAKVWMVNAHKVSRTLARGSLHRLVRSVQAHKPAKNAAISRASNSGSSAGAKWPPLGIGVHRRTLYRRSAHSRGGWPSGADSLAKTAIPVGTPTTSRGPTVTADQRLSK